MRKVLLSMLILLPVYLFFSLYFADKCYFLCPIKYQRDIVIRSDSMGEGVFGSRRSGGRLHQGLDLYAEVGTPILASRSGVVARTGSAEGMGNFIVLKHPGGIFTVYGHLSEIYVRPLELVRQGEVIGAVGKTGNANYKNMQPHLHFEVRQGGLAHDPVEYLQ
ncbi:MAG: M23 family metallopeptidase [Candidatus Paceibacterota bacterium]|jgi:murein DD-endopeptidase MepM/ murein hydrolase activator NlpD